MKAQDLIDHLNQQGSWVDFDKTRDIVLFGNPDQEITRIGVCWVATIPAIETAIKNGVNFIISHENCFYEESTSPRKDLLVARKMKMDLLAKHGICVFRCHDVWDRMPEFGVADRWAKTIDLKFEPRLVNTYYSFANFEPTKVEDLARKVAKALKPYGQDSVTVLGDPSQLVSSLATGTGAITDIFSMIKGGAQCFVVTDDGINNWIASQYCVDHHLPMIIVHHSISEISGLYGMLDYLKLNFKEIETVYLPENYHYHAVQ
jgi:putative NIF3 family GTP cyclohydrolase 1 type 2